MVEVLEAAGGALAAVEKASIDEVYVDVTRAATTVLSRVEAFDRQDSSSGPSCHEQQQQLEEDDKSCGVGEWGEWGDMGAGGWEQVASDAAGTHVSTDCTHVVFRFVQGCVLKISQRIGYLECL